MPTPPDTINLFLRKFPAKLHRALKVKAAQNGRDLRDEVIERLVSTLKAQHPTAPVPVAAPDAPSA